MRALPICVTMLLLSGCVGPRESSRAWLVYVREVPVARVTLASASQGNVVDVAVRGNTAGVTLRHSGLAKLERLREPPGLKVALHEVDVRALAQGRYSDVERALDEASPTGSDDLALALLKATTDNELARVAEREDGRRTLARLYSELTSGSVWDDEREQSQRVLGLWAQRIGPERFARAIEDERTKIFPVRQSGATVAYPASPTVRIGTKELEVLFSSNVYHYEEWQTFQGMYPRVADDEVVAVKLYDAGGVIRFVPALFLLEVSNAGERHTLLKCGEMVALGLTLGAGGVAGATGRATSALVWCDRAALVLGVVLSVVDEHRGWILERYGAKGARFLRYMDGLASLVAFYGLGRIAVAVPRAVLGLRQAYLEMRATKAALSAEERGLVDGIGRNVDELLEQAEKASKGADVIPIERARKPVPAPAVEEEALRATGTDGRLVPVGDERGGPTLVASKGDGGPKNPLNTRVPALQGSGVAGGGRAGRPVASVPPAEREILTALTQRGIPETQALAAAQAASDLHVLAEVEALVKSPGYRNPENLRNFLRGWNAGNEGKIQALEDAIARSRRGHQVVLEGGGADVVDYTTREAIQHKRIFGDSGRDIKDRISEAARQLRGETGELPPQGFTRVVDLRFDVRSGSPMRNADKNMLRAVIPPREGLQQVDRVQITTDRGTFLFEPPFPQWSQP